MKAHGPTGDVGPRLSYVASLDPVVVLVDVVPGVVVPGVVVPGVVVVDVLVLDVLAPGVLVLVDDVERAVDVVAEDVFAVDDRGVDAIVTGCVDAELTAGAEEPAPVPVEFVALHPLTTRAATTIHGAAIEPARDMVNRTQPDEH